MILQANSKLATLASPSTPHILDLQYRPLLFYMGLSHKDGLQILVLKKSNQQTPLLYG